MYACSGVFVFVCMCLCVFSPFDSFRADREQQVPFLYYRIMSTTVKISQKLQSRIALVKAKSAGRLYGIANNGTLLLGFSLTDSIEHNLPFYVKDVGRIQWTDGSGNDATDNNDDDLVLTYNFKTAELLIQTKDKSGDWLDATHDELTEAEIWKEWVCLRTKFTLKYQIDGSALCKQQLQQLLDETKKKLCETDKPVIKVDGTEIVLKKDKVFVGIGKSTKLSAVVNQARKESVNADGSKPDPTQFEVVNFTISPSDEGVDDISAVFGNIDLGEDKTTIDIDFEALAIVRAVSPASLIYDHVLKSIDRCISNVAANLTDVARPLRTFVFYPRAAGHFISFVYPTTASNDDADQIAQRKKNHENLYLMQVCLRRDDIYSFEPPTNQPHLINPHIGLKSLVKNGKQYIVKGEYAYHHYMQDNFNDDGWGCAYRSFQTVFSWYQRQGYTNKPVPTHAQIQQCLIDLDDKPKTFLNSRQWIGSMEVSMCLQHFIGVDARIMHVRSGAEMAQHGPTLAQHFTTYGTPVMIGGGVLAHTIIGVDFNSETNDLRFLVLDPHYTGTDDLATVQKKGWCGWKPVTFWDKKSYYNFCMPVFPFVTDY